MHKPTKIKNVFDGVQHFYFFPNGYGASVIRHQYSYGGSEGKWELAVITGNEEDFRITYDTSITFDVLGYLTDTEVETYLTQIESLCPNIPSL